MRAASKPFCRLKRRGLLAVAALALSVLSLIGSPSLAAVPSAGLPEQTGRVWMRLRTPLPADSAAREARLANLAARIGQPLVIDDLHAPGTYGVRIDVASGNASLDAASLAARLREQPEVEQAVAERWMRPMALPNDPAVLTRQWFLFDPAQTFSSPGRSRAPVGAANALAAHDLSQGAGVTVAILDTGVRLHGDLQANLLPGYDFVSALAYVSAGLPVNFVANDGDGREADATDPGDWITSGEAASYSAVIGGCSAANSSWHGTHVAGLVAAAADNHLNGIGVAPGAKILPVRVLGKCGAPETDVADGIRWAAGLPVTGVPANPNPARIINLSLGGAGSCNANAPMAQAIAAVIQAGSLVVAAAGNDGAAVGYPANCPGVLAVGAASFNGDLADYANRGNEIGLLAPGGGAPLQLAAAPALNSAELGIASTFDSGLTSPTGDDFVGLVGSSLAAPIASGAAALVAAVLPTATPAQIKTILQASARAFPIGGFCLTPGGNNNCGSGLLDAFRAVTDAIQQTYPMALASAAPVVAPGQAVNLSAQGSTALSGKTLTAYQWTQLSGPAVILRNASTSQAQFDAPVTGVLVFAVQVTDSAALSRQATVTVRVNTAPVLKPVANQMTAPNQTLRFRLSAADADGNTIHYLNLAAPANATLDPATGDFVWTPTKVGTYSLKVQPSDDLVAGAPVEITLEVGDGSAPTTVSASSGGGGSFDAGLLGLAGALWMMKRVRRSRRSRFDQAN